MFQLRGNRKPLTEPTLRLEWELNKSDVDKLTEKQLFAPHVLIIVTKVTHYDRGIKEESFDEYEETDRKLIPLGNGATYVEFNQPGKYRIFGIVVGDSEGKRKDLFKQHLENKRSRVGSYDGKLSESTRSSFPLSRYLDVMVGKEFFANEPSAFERWWVNLWFESEPKNSCQFGKRRFLAYSIQPLVYLLWFIIVRLGIRTVATIVLALGGYRRINWKAAFDPFHYSVDDIWDDVKGGDSVFNETKSGSNDRWWAAFVMPPMLLLYAVLYSQWDFVGPAFHYVVTNWYVHAALEVIVGAIVLAFIAVHIEKAIKKFVADLRKEERASLEQQLAELALQGKKNAPLAPKPLRLRYEELKAKRCRPYLLKNSG